ncbi:MAG: polysaccharide deacetylase family protein [Bacteroidales bacterium]|nr:polysaccharide deacetylase family protein [Bacteroidales bacterium]
MFFYSTPHILQKISPTVLQWKVETQVKEIFLTFDDGPVAGVTHEVLNVLDQYQAKATFFCNGKQALENPQIIEKIKQSGHCLGNHTYGHIDGWRSSVKDYLEDVKRCEDVFCSSLFRPPFGRITCRQARLLSRQYHIVMWSLMTYDFHPEIKPEQSLKIMKRKASPGSIILMHDSGKAGDKVIGILTGILEYFSLAGFTFSSLEKVFPKKA